MITVNIKFKNESEISCLDNDKETKRGIMRGRILSDKEYDQMIDREIASAENKVSELVKKIYDNNPYIRKPSEFCEQFLGAKLLRYQKKLLNMQYKGQIFIQTKSQYKKYETYLRLLLAYVNMKEDGRIAIAQYPDDVKILNKEKFGVWLCNYWK